MSLQFNIKNNNTDFPLFFGDPVGLFDSFNIKYPQIEAADIQQQSLFWKAKEISMVQDSKDLMSLSDVLKEIFIRALSFQMAADSMASGSIAQLFLPICSNPQLESLISYHSMTESTHAKSYGNMIATVFKDPNKLLERIRDDERMIYRLGFILENFKAHNEMLKDLANDTFIYSENDQIKILIKTIATLLALEGIMFLSSFASTFAVCEITNKLNGIDKEIGLIFNDEVLHANNCIIMLDILSKEHPEIWEQMIPVVKLILDNTIKAEEQWSKDLFIDTDVIVGFNSRLLSDYTKYLAEPIYTRLKLNFEFSSVKENPLPWIDPHIKQDLTQVAAQEAQLTNYMTGSSVDDTFDTEFDY